MQVSDDLLIGTFSSLSLGFSTINFLLSGQFFPLGFSIPLKVFEEILKPTFCHQLRLNSNFTVGVRKNKGYYSYGEFLFGLRENFHL